MIRASQRTPRPRKSPTQAIPAHSSTTKSYATVIEISGNSVVLIEPLEGEPERASADRIWVNIDGFSDVGAEIGSTVDITYDGYIMETYPAQIRASAWSLVN